MNKKTLIKTNKFLKVAAVRNSLIHSNAITSARIEGIFVTAKSNLFPVKSKHTHAKSNLFPAKSKHAPTKSKLFPTKSKLRLSNS